MSNNKFLSPFIIQKSSMTGNITRERVNPFEVILNEEIKLSFDNHFKHKSDENGDLIEWSYLVACTELGISATEIEEKLLPIIDDFLLIASFASRQRTACLGWAATDDNSHVTFYRCDITPPKYDEKHDIDDGVI